MAGYVYEVVLKYREGDEAFFTHRRPRIGETLQIGDETWVVAYEEPLRDRHVAARFICRPGDGESGEEPLEQVS